MDPHRFLKLMELRAGQGDKKEGPQPNLFFLGLYDSSVTVKDQQTRALNLAWALASEGRLGPSQTVAVIGAGAAGLTFAASARIFGSPITVLEKGPRPFHVFLPPSGTVRSKRFVHPHVASWPSTGWHIPQANLPLGSWNADTPSSVARQIFDNSLAPDCNQYSIPVELWCNTLIDSLKKKDKRWQLVWTGEEMEWADAKESFCRARPIPAGSIFPKTECKLFNLVVLAVGYGYERQYYFATGKESKRTENHRTPITPSYWDPQSETIRDSGNDYLFVSGTGDGGIADALLFLGCSLNRDFITRLKKLQDSCESWGAVAWKLQTLRRTALKHDYRHPNYVEDFQAIEQKYPSFAKGFRDMLETNLASGNRHVQFNSTRIGVLSTNKSLLNCFLAWNLEKMGYASFLKGRVSEFKEAENDLIEVRFDDARPTTVQALVVRHGPELISSKDNSDDDPLRHYLEDAQGPLAEKNDVDLSRLPFWPRKFFGRSNIHAVTAQRQVGIHELLSAEIETVAEEVHFRPHTLNDSKALPQWVDLSATISLENLRLYRKLFLEHEVVQSQPFRLNLDGWESSKNTIVKPDIADEHVVPPWALAYTLEKETDDDEKDHVQLTISGQPATACWLADGFGFPVYPDIKVQRLKLEVTFEYLRPMEPHLFISVFRRSAYSEVTEETTVIFSKSLTAKPIDNGYTISCNWPNDDLPENVSKPENLGGHFLGIRWLALKPIPKSPEEQ